ncbi:hypothetical protein BDB01DRAFT_901219 [Pilobolus umbonatus]|nr:hypothetical protein BDB01DRAFT_901219 [Pilobolus umbonatus]
MSLQDILNKANVKKLTPPARVRFTLAERRQENSEDDHDQSTTPEENVNFLSCSISFQAFVDRCFSCNNLEDRLALGLNRLIPDSSAAFVVDASHTNDTITVEPDFFTVYFQQLSQVRYPSSQIKVRIRDIPNMFLGTFGGIHQFHLHLFFPALFRSAHHDQHSGRKVVMTALQESTFIEYILLPSAKSILPASVFNKLYAFYSIAKAARIRITMPEITAEIRDHHVDSVVLVDL